MLRIRRGAVALGVAVFVGPGCVVGPALPGVVEPGAAVTMRLEPAAPVTARDDTGPVRVTRLTGRVLAVDSVEIVLLVRALQALLGG